MYQLLYLCTGKEDERWKYYFSIKTRELPLLSATKILSLFSFSLYIYTYIYCYIYIYRISFCGIRCLIEVMAEINGLYGSIEEFLKQCRQSGDSAYSAFRSLLERLEDPTTRVEARIFLSKLQKRFDSEEAIEQCLDTYHFRIQDIYLEQEGPILFLSQKHSHPLHFLMCVCVYNVYG